MARNQNTFEKRRREVEKKQRAEEKRKRRQAKKQLDARATALGTRPREAPPADHPSTVVDDE